MSDQERVPCPYCRELILADAIKCKECGSTLKKPAMARIGTAWYRNLPEKKFFGVSACIAKNLHISVTLVRLGFVLATFLHLLGVLTYLALVALIPYEQGGRSWFEMIVDSLSAAMDSFKTRPIPAVPATVQTPPAPPAPAAPEPPTDSNSTPSGPTN